MVAIGTKVHVLTMDWPEVLGGIGSGETLHQKFYQGRVGTVLASNMEGLTIKQEMPSIGLTSQRTFSWDDEIVVVNYNKPDGTPAEPEAGVMYAEWFENAGVKLGAEVADPEATRRAIWANLGYEFTTARRKLVDEVEEKSDQTVWLFGIGLLGLIFYMK